MTMNDQPCMGHLYQIPPHSRLRECGVLKSECVLELEEGQMNCETLSSGRDMADTPMNSRAAVVA